MNKLIPGTNLRITSDGIIVDKNGNECDRSILKDGEYVTISFYNKLRRIHIPWLIKLAITQTSDADAFDNVEFYTYKPINGSSERIGVIFNKPIQYILNKKFRLVPGYPCTVVDKNGVCISITTGNTHIQNCNKYGYKYVNVYDPQSSKWRSVMVHTLVALAWVKNSSPEEKIVVNHKDGDKQNNYYNNLEWVTQEENAIHARDNGLLTSAIPCSVRNILTQEITTYPSISKMITDTHIGIHKQSVSMHTFSNPYKLFDNKYEIRLSTDKTPWFYTSENIVDMVNITNSKYIIITNENSIRKIFHGPEIFRQYYNISRNKYKSIESMINHLKSVNPYIKVDILQTFKQSDIEILNIDTESIVVCKTTRAAAAYVGLSQQSILKQLAIDDTKTYIGKFRYRIRYKKCAPWNNIIAQPIDNYNKTFKVLNKTTNKITEYTSLRSIALDINRCRKYIRRCILNPSITDEYVITYS